MPIGDLLAQISGENSPSASTFPRSTTSSSLPAKRKPENDLRHDIAKSPRPNPSRPAVARDKWPPPPRLSQQSPRSAAVPKPSAPPKTLKPAVPARPGPSPTTPSSATAKQSLKRGSFAEILARGQRAQAVMGQVGKIQHKKVEKGPAKTKDEAKPQPPKGKAAAAAAASSASASYKGTSKPVANNHPTANGSRSKPAPAGKRQEPAVNNSNGMKKPSQPVTGYTGTARPKQGLPSKKRDAPRGGALLNPPSVRHGSSKRSRYDDDDDDDDAEDLDDFIEYDDDEDEAAQPGPRYNYAASDASSDMEAGLDELDVEERRAELLARREDIQEERLERSLKAAKEDRKRRAMDAFRAGKR
ncbi:hypothetical protein L249_3839 [Ophiocordyceps polyrhachis-furcata BCC 54312]|uniref:SPT2 chromatin protein n=1 Tax=Ophiocordyceps polyrhachis-furcata BCC 54312 TaxID=1330021 RepID=A0A367L600_9HYPO|nr:hypothetical protein L249_3839 [Ophiocordyceps polyrhachis-furcata BCC 54312]